MDLIDILWKQDIDLGAGREVFDYSHRQKQYEIEKQKKLEKERLEELQREQEKALLAQLQLDEETGEFVPILPARSVEAVAASVPNHSIQNKGLQGHGALSFDECMQLLSETFPFDVHETQPATFLPLVPESCPESGSIFIAPDEPSSIFHGVKTEQDNLNDLEENVIREIEQVWEELLSIPELQCLNIENESLTDVDMFPIQEAKPPETDQNYGFYSPMSFVGKEMNPNPIFHSPFQSSFTSSLPMEDLNYLKSDPVDICSELYTTFMDPKGNGNLCTPNSSLFTELLNEPVDMADLSLCPAFNEEKSAPTPEFIDSDSGVSINSSPNSTSPEPSVASSLYGDTAYNYSDSEMEDVDSAPGSVVQNHLLQSLEESSCPSSPATASKMQAFGVHLKNSPRKEVPISPGHNRSPFAKDKYLSRLEARFTRDSQKAKSLQIPFSVDNIINLPVDDFNELMSKHQLNEAQLSLIRDIRRRGKNKVAAQNCRKRKMENIVELEQDLDHLKDEKDKLLAEKVEYNKDFQLLKKQLSVLYMEVFSQLRDEEGNPYSPSEYSLQQTRDGDVFLVPKNKKIEDKRD